MARAITPSTIICLGAMMLSGGGVSGAEIYKWVGSDGVTHFTETAPAVDLAGVEVLEFAASEPAAMPARDYRSMLAVAKDIEASRLERERLRLEKRKLLLESRQPVYNAGYTDSRYYPLYFRYPRKPHAHRYRYGHPVKPAPLPHRRGYGGHGTPRPPQARVHLDR